MKTMAPLGKKGRRVIFLHGTRAGIHWAVLIMLVFVFRLGFPQNSYADESSGVQDEREQQTGLERGGAGLDIRREDNFAAGKWVVSAYGSGTSGKSSRTVYSSHFGFGYHFIDNLSLNLQATGYFIDQPNDTGGAGVDLVPRWHFWKREDWSLYLDGGAGLIYTEAPLRDPGTKFNFTLQGGLGTTYNYNRRFVPVAGIRWFHISNARIEGKNRNVGFDAPMIYLGFMTPIHFQD